MVWGRDGQIGSNRMGKSDAFGQLPEHLSKSDPQCYWLWLLIIDRETQTHTHTCMFFWTIHTNETPTRKYTHSFLFSDRGHQDHPIVPSPPPNHMLMENERESETHSFIWHGREEIFFTIFTVHISLKPCICGVLCKKQHAGVSVVTMYNNVRKGIGVFVAIYKSAKDFLTTLGVKC